MKQLLVITAILAAFAQVSAETLSFDLADPKGVNSINFNLDGALDSINGNANGVTGRVQFDPDVPEKTTGLIQIDTRSLYVPNPTMNGHLHGRIWMDVANHQEIRFTLAKLENVETTGNVTNADVSGELTVKGVTRPINARATITYLRGKLKARMGPRGPDGDLIVIRTRFSINRSDFGINAGENEEKVADEIEISMSIAGQSPY